MNGRTQSILKQTGGQSLIKDRWFFEAGCTDVNRGEAGLKRPAATAAVSRREGDKSLPADRTDIHTRCQGKGLSLTLGHKFPANQAARGKKQITAPPDQGSPFKMTEYFRDAQQQPGQIPNKIIPSPRQPGGQGHMSPGPGQWFWPRQT